MAKPKGATLTQLFAVSEKEREQFWAKIRPGNSQEGTSPVEGIPVTGTPITGPPVSGTHQPPDTPTVIKGMPAAAAILGFPPSQPAGGPLSGTPLTGIPDKGPPVTGQPQTRRKIREATKVQDGHSLGEQAVYAALWAEGQPHTDESRRIIVGYRTLSDLCGLTVNNCKANLQALREKLAIEELAAATPSQGTTYLVHSYQSILRRRRLAGMTHVIKTKGVQFVNPESGVPVSGIPDTLERIPEKGIPERISGIPVSDERGVPVSAPPVRNKNLIKETALTEEITPPSSSSFPAIAAAARQHGLTLDDDAVRRIVLRCQAFDETATEAEVAHFLAVKVQQLGRSGRVGNWPGLLIKAVPEFFSPPATELQHLREQRARELEQGRELARQILADPEASDSDRAWAEEALAAARLIPSNQ